MSAKRNIVDVVIVIAIVQNDESGTKRNETNYTNTKVITHIKNECYDIDSARNIQVPKKSEPPRHEFNRTKKKKTKIYRKKNYAMKCVAC